MMISEKKWGISKMKCSDCEHYYVKTSNLGTCIRKQSVVHSVDDVCNRFLKRKVDTVSLLHDIAEQLMSGQSAVVLLADGSPMFTLSNELNVNQTDIILRTYCKPGVTYTIVPLEEE